MKTYTTIKKEYKSLYKTYYKKLKEYQDLMFELPAGPMAYFAVFLQYLRDVYLLADERIATSTEYSNPVVETLTEALLNYDSYRISTDKHDKAIYDLSRLAEGEDRTELEKVAQKWAEEKMKFFNAFWDMVKKYYLMWLRGNKACN